MKQTAVEFLLEEFSEILGKIKTQPMQDLLLVDAVKLAKKIEIEQLKNAWDSSDTNMRNQFSSSAYKGITFNEWFETFKNK